MAEYIEEDQVSPQYQAWLDERARTIEVAEYLTWWRKEQALEDVRDAAADKPVWKV
jgi:hypothetical protein